MKLLFLKPDVDKIETTIRLKIIEFFQWSIEKIASIFFNYPEVKGMPSELQISEKKQEILDYISKLPVHRTAMPPLASPQTFGQVFFGNVPKLAKIERTYYFSAKEGYYNFYFQNFKNIYFLPNWLSKWIQLNFHITTNIRPLVIVQEVVFVLLVSYYFLLEFRLKLFWFLTINPYTRPLVYLLSLTDWLVDNTQGVFPTTFGIDCSPTLIMMVMGRVVDSINHLVFTMPFLPCEGTVGQRLAGKRMMKVVVYRYLPHLWEEYPIPNDIREYWYKDNPKILKFMKKSYGHLEIDFEPDRILKKMYDEQHITKLIHENIDNVNHLSTNIISDISLNYHHNLDNFTSNYIHICSHIFDKIS